MDADGSPAIRVVIADDQRVVRDALTTLLELLDGITVVGAALDGEDAVRQAVRQDPDVILMDLEMPVLSGVEAIERLRADGIRARVIVLTTYTDGTSVLGAIRAGADGYLTKDAGAAELRAAIITVHDGGVLLDGTAQRGLVQAVATSPAPPPPQQPAQGLSEREAEVLTLLARGLSNRQIAAALGVTVPTVKTHVARLLARTRTRNRVGLVRYAFEHGIADR